MRRRVPASHLAVEAISDPAIQLADSSGTSCGVQEDSAREAAFSFHSSTIMGSLGRSSLFALGVSTLVLGLWPAAASARSDRITLEGTLLVKHGDVFREPKAEYWYWLLTKHGRVK